MKILFCLKDIPHDLADGYNLRIFHLAQNLKASHELCMLINNRIDGKRRKFMGRLAGIEIHQMDDYKVLEADVSAGFGNFWDRRLMRYIEYNIQYHNAVKTVCNARRPDAVVAFHMKYAPYLIGLHNTLTVCDIIDDPLRSLTPSFHSYHGMKSYLKYILWVFGAYMRILGKIDLLVAVTEEDALGIKKYVGNKKIFAIKNGVDSDYFAPRREGETPAIVFTGNMDFPPNVSAVLYFIKEVWPRISANDPWVQFWVVGRNPARAVIEAASQDDRIQVLGYVHDMRDYIGRAWVSVAPMIDGTGIKNKILEAWSMGKPVVATPLALQGLSARNDETVLTAGDAQGFSLLVLRLLKDEEYRVRIGGNARRHVLHHYSWQKQSEELSSILKKMRLAVDNPGDNAKNPNRLSH